MDKSMNLEKVIALGKKVKANKQLYEELSAAGFEYVLNPKTDELHKVGLADFWGSHNLKNANLDNFLYLKNLSDAVPMHEYPDGTGIPIYHLETRQHLMNYVLNKCKHCFV
ncbi:MULTISPECIES: hypothetical protein [Trichocoleus]|uniref:Uncharacterized protein n=1 Tax=Trichocoleus desertorum GB2-A4 TaxID=2933944 RepID=A0ABV0JGC3_9CYAN|nr:hypothetical protein [Trichocoleus sp. FACHB-46]MBD1865275.1 hypothetical protein [Trichocoleus sp. FACHB-46]